MLKNRVRHLIAGMIFCSTMSIYFGRINLSTAIVEMSRRNKDELTELFHDACYTNRSSIVKQSIANSSDNKEDADKFNWNQSAQGIILGAFFWGYFAFQVPSGRMAERFGARLLGTIGIMGTAAVNLLTPLITKHYYVFVSSRILLGAIQALVFPSCYLLASKWIPDNERSTVLSLTPFGGVVGAILSTGMSGFLSKHGFAGGWPSVFYVSGEKFYSKLSFSTR